MNDLVKSIFRKTFGGLSSSYLIRQYIFSIAIGGFLIYLALSSPNGTGGVNGDAIFLFIISTLLYPYSRFVYESIVGLIMGNNVFFVNAALMLTVKLFTILLCYFFALFIAPLGLLYLYFYHSKKQE